MTGSNNAGELIEAWTTVMKNEISPHGKAWVLYENGTVVLVEEKQSVETVTVAAEKVMKKSGPVYPGSEHGDFNTVQAPSVKGVIVTGHCSTMFNIVLPSVMKDLSNQMVVGLTGRGMRDQDSQTCKVIHVQMPEA